MQRFGIFLMQNRIIKDKLKEFLKVGKVELLVLEYQKGNYHKIFHFSAKLTASSSDINEAFKSSHQSIMTKIKNSATKDWPVETMIKLVQTEITAQINKDNEQFILVN